MPNVYDDGFRKWLLARCGSCERELYLCSTEEFFVVHSPLLFCSEACLEKFERSIDAYFERMSQE
jgi:hypothetical protein